MNRFFEFDKAMTRQLCPPVEQEKLTVYIGCSRWTNPNRPHARHIAPEHGQPLCGKTYRAGANDRYELNQQTAKDITCDRCRKLAALDLKYQS